MDIAAMATGMKTAEIANRASIMMLKNSMDSMEQIATQLVDQLLTLNVGSVQPSMLDVSV